MLCRGGGNTVLLIDIDLKTESSTERFTNEFLCSRVTLRRPLTPELKDYSCTTSGKSSF